MNIVSFLDGVGKYGTDRHGPDDCKIRHLGFHASYIRLDIPTQNMYNILLFHVNNIYITAPQFYGYSYTVRLVLC